jgi:hypothetical protein
MISAFMLVAFAKPTLADARAFEALGGYATNIALTEGSGNPTLSHNGGFFP